MLGCSACGSGTTSREREVGMFSFGGDGYAGADVEGGKEESECKKECKE